jgi:hypothetical protein
MLSDTLLRELLLTQLLKPQGSMAQVDDVLKWIEDFKKKEKEKSEKAKGGVPNKPIFSVRDMFFILLGIGPFGGLFFLQGLAYVWNMTSEAVHMMH